MAELVRNVELRFSLMHDILGVNYGNGDVLPQLFDECYKLEGFIMIVVISAILMVIGNSVTRILTKEKIKVIPFASDPRQSEFFDQRL
jgi:hypothetical protein